MQIDDRSLGCKEDTVLTFTAGDRQCAQKKQNAMNIGEHGVVYKAASGSQHCTVCA